MGKSKADSIEKTEEEWRTQLTPEQYRVTRKAGTERAFSHDYSEEKRDGTYTCICCGEALFEAKNKYDSGTGWPSYWAAANNDAVSEHDDSSLFMSRTEVRCAKCESHLGHVFPDGPEPTGLRYCINGEALDFKAADEDEGTTEAA